MKLDLNKFYNYIFGDWSDIKKYVKKELSAEAKASVIKKRTQEIQEFFSECLTDETKPKFRAALRTFNASDLEQLIFGNITDELKESYHFPATANGIEGHFDRLEQQYNFFNEEKSLVIAKKRFSAFFKVCKLIGDVIEKNNDALDSVAALHAYKIMVLFSNDLEYDFRPLDHYLQSFNFYTSDHPLHDALLMALPKNIQERPLNISVWRQIIQATGPKSSFVFNIANEIETLLKRAPHNYAEAVDVARGIRFRNADKNPILAELFLQYGHNEDLFEYCLRIEKRRKTKDNLPDISVAGVAVDKPGYHLIKLPFTDPRAFVLGSITNCCQSIGGHSERCVIDGITCENNGFYILLKSKKPADSKSLPSDAKGNINYKDFEIVGQGYAWLGVQGCLTFDSWENLTPKRDDEVIVALLKKFAEKVINAAGSTILRVTIGVGGKSPASYVDNICLFPDVIREGYQYIDSANQSEIFCSEEKRKPLVEELKKIVYQQLMLLNDKNAGRGIIDNVAILTDLIAAPCCSSFYSEKIQDLFGLQEVKDFLKKMLPEKYLFARNVLPASIIIKLVSLQLVSHLDTIRSIHSIYPDLLGDILAGLEKLKKFAIKEDEYIDRSMQSDPWFFLDFVDCLVKLKEINLADNKDVRESLIVFGVHCFSITDALLRLKKLAWDDDADIQRCILIDPEYDEKIVSVFEKLHEAKLGHDVGIRQCVLSKTETALSVANAYIILKKLTLEKDSEIRSCILQHPENALDLAEGFQFLKPLNLLIEDKFRNVFLQQPGKTRYLVVAYKKLIELGLANDTQLVDLLLENLQSGLIVLNAFMKIRKASIELTDQLRQSLFANPKEAGNVVAKIIDSYAQWGFFSVAPVSAAVSLSVEQAAVKKESKR